MNTGYTFRFPEPPTAYSILSPSGTLMVKIMLDGTIEYGEGYTPDAAARVFWEAMTARQPAREVESLRAQLADAEAVVDEVRRLVGMVSHPGSVIDGVKALIAERDQHFQQAMTNGQAALAAEAERGRAVKDAERYRWLRTESGNDISAPFVCGVHGAPMGDAGWLTGKHLDAAIDAAIATAAGEAESATARC